MQLFKHQKVALDQTEQFNRVGYFLDMGLGKTFVGSEKMWELNTQCNLVVCQKSKVQDWVDHFRIHYPEYDIFPMTSKVGQGQFQWAYENYKNGTQQFIGVINYDLLFRRSYMAHIEGFTLILDESQVIQNEKAKRSKFVLNMKPENVILLSGTPTSGKYERLWSQVRLLGWDISKTAYWNSFIETEWIEDHNTGYKREVVVGYKNTERLKKKLSLHGAVFMKTEEAFELPEQKEITIKMNTSKEYRKFMKHSYVELPEKELIGDTVLVKFLYARQLCGQYSKEKLEAFEDLVDSTGDRLIVFYNFYEELNSMVDIVNRLERPYSVVNGQTKDLTAYEEADDSVTFVQYQSGATGLNLQKANKTVYFTLPFGKGSCATWEQSKKRTHRIGQEKSCFYYYLLCKGSIEEKNLINLRLGKEYNDKLFEREFT